MAQADNRNGTSVFTQGIETELVNKFTARFDQLKKLAKIKGKRFNKGSFLEDVMKTSPLMADDYDVKSHFEK